MSIRTIHLAQEFSPCPAGRFPTDGPFPGATFRDTFLLPAIRNNEKVVVDFAGTEMAGSSFLEEAFGGLVRAGVPEALLKQKLELNSPRPSDPKRIWRYIHEEASR
jgi:hypothetical protein